MDPQVAAAAQEQLNESTTEMLCLFGAAKVRRPKLHPQEGDVDRDGAMNERCPSEASMVGNIRKTRGRHITNGLL